MPEQITSKNLSYNSSLPPFLQRLHAQAGGATGPDPLLAAHKRSAKKRSSSEEAEDAPLVVDEHGNRVNVQVGRDGTVKDVEEEAGPANRDDGHDDDVVSKPDEKTRAEKEKQDAETNSSIGVRKRKVGRVIGQDSPIAASKSEVREKSSSAGKDHAQGVSKVKKKVAKKIKLSFDQDGEEG
ncbi:hypothetical protein E4U43_006027 [Claviceps pusilla]|uniref:DUF4604 domain-containing protein n=1 Tax=Claviceps pusilla TaxID=123648 RepID=A0A9P7STQ8_9HYPO|nr:hypothetical protein E4U43_006027 [Claviceps pusilla]